MTDRVFMTDSVGTTAPLAQPFSQPSLSRRSFLGASSVAFAGSAIACAQADGPSIVAANVDLPRGRVPVSFVIDDSTCLVNMGHFCTPQFAEAWPSRAVYQKPWQSWPREIPDAFVREFGSWCAEQGVKGKYSIVPFPACVGWLDRELPGWSRRDLQASLQLVRELMVPNWDIHPEMITHTRVIDLKTGRPLPEINPATMENSFPQARKSVDEMADYLAYALRLVKNCELPCEGVTTPGGFGNAVKAELSLAVDEAVREVFPQVEVPHYFKYVRSGDENAEPEVEHLRGRGDDLRYTMNVPAGTGDWFGGWQGDGESEPDRYLTADGQAGRMLELIERRQPAIMLCHWPGMYCNGSKSGFHAFQRIVLALAEHHADKILWMKMSEIAHYYAAKKLTEIRFAGDEMVLQSPVSSKNFTVRMRLNFEPTDLQILSTDDEASAMSLKRVTEQRFLSPGQFTIERRDSTGQFEVLLCFNLLSGVTWLRCSNQ